MIYRVEIIGDDGASEGFTFFASQSDVRRHVRKRLSEGYKPEDFDVDSLPTPKTKTQVIELLEQWASHEMNG